MNNNELYHHGVLGMRWGIRRFQPYGQGGYNPKREGHNVQKVRTEKAERKEAKRLEKEKRRQEKQEKKEKRRRINEMIGSHVDYMEEYGSTSEGAKKLKRYEAAISKMENAEDWTHEDDEWFGKIEMDYLSSAMRYVGKKMVAEYGEASIREMDPGIKGTGKEFIDDYVKRNKYVHAI